jgi:hypothetical protein
MLSLRHDGLTFCDGLTRREWLRVGGIGLGGLTLAHLLRQPVQAAPRSTGGGRAKSVIIFGLLGGPPQHETWGPKPVVWFGEFGRTPRVGRCRPAGGA